MTSARNLPDWEGSFPLADELSKALGTRVALGNDVQVATDAEALLGAGRPYRSLLGVFWGTGVGGGIVLDGRPWVGRGAAGEIGHVVVKRDGARCTCGRRGCMEAYAGRGVDGAARPRQAQERAPRRTSSRSCATAAATGSRAASGRERWTAATRSPSSSWTTPSPRSAPASASVQNVLDVEAIVIGGGLGIRMGEPYAKRILDAMLPHLFVDIDPPAVQVAALGDLGGAIGASLLVNGPA